MKKATLFFIVSAVAVSALASNLTTSQAVQPELDYRAIPRRSSMTNILNATIQVAVYPIESCNDRGEIQLGSIFDRGLATLVQAGRENLLVSHDHWNALENACKVVFRNAAGQLLAEISGEEFVRLIQYHDGGTLLLSTPPVLRPEYQALLAAHNSDHPQEPLEVAQLGDSQAVEAGQVVEVTYGVGEYREHVGILTATIVSVSDLNGARVFKLKSADGTAIYPGDSGGGIWLQGQFVGNMWMSEWVYDWRIWTWDSLQPAVKSLDTSFAALVPFEEINLLAGQSASEAEPVNSPHALDLGN